MAPSEMDKNKRGEILVIDDDREIGNLLKKVLEREKYSVQTATSGMDGMVLMRQKAFDLVITDYQMPGMSGLDIIHWSRAVLPGLKIILMTACIDSAAYFHDVRSGVFAFVHKPVKMRDLIALVRKACAGSGVKHVVHSS